MLRNKIVERKLCVGSWCQIGHPANAEILAASGFEWITADCEHGEFEDGDIGNFCRAVKLAGSVPLVRVRENALIPIRRALDLGADGVIVPLVDNAADAAKAVSAALYPPAGIRGFAWQRANGWGMDFDSYAKNFKPLLIVMIESRSAVENIDEILDVDGVDGCLIGPYDMSGSYGIVGQTGHELILNACEKIADACRRHKKVAGQHIVIPDKTNVKTALAQGYTFIALGMDSFFLKAGAKAALELA